MDDDLIELIQTSFGSIWTLELLLLVASNAERLWSRGDLVSELRSSEQVVGRSTDELTMAGLVVVGDGGSVRYAPASRDLDDLVQKLIDVYPRTPTAIRRLILKGPTGKLISFVDAFDLRKKN